MKALIWKECHENIKWAGLLLVLLGGGIALAGPPPSIMYFGTLFYLGLIAAVSAAALGFLQVFFGARGDRRALLLHRPISHSQVFLSKAISGVVLYLLAVGIPYAATVAWKAMPGHAAAPFRAGMALPWLADILTGVVWYFAGMLVAQREGRWYGSRTLALAAALLASFLVWTVPEFWQALLVIVALGTIVAVAAWGSFITGGAHGPQQSGIAKAALGATLVAGLLAVGFVGKLLFGAWFDTDERSYFMLDRSGRVLIVRQERGKDTRVTDLEGRIPAALEGKRPDPNMLREIEARLSPHALPKFDTYRNPARFIIRYQNDTMAGGERWFYVPAEGLLLGYDRESKRFIGSIGPDGFSGPHEQPTARFMGKPYYGDDLYEAGPATYLDFPDGVYTVDFARRSVETLFTPPEGEAVGWAIRWWDNKRKRSLVVIGTHRSVQVVDESATLLFSAPLEQNPESGLSVRVGRLENPDRFVVWYEPSLEGGLAAYKRTPTHLVEYDPSGKEVARRTVPPRPLGEPQAAATLFGLATSITEGAALAAASGPIIAGSGSIRDQRIRALPFVLVMTTRYFIPGAGPNTRSDRNLDLAFRTLIVLSAVLSVLVCFMLTRRHAFTRAHCFAWSLCGVLFGPAGPLLLLALEDWPARIACPACGKVRVVTLDTCEHCGAPHAVPDRDGTEILEGSPSSYMESTNQPAPVELARRSE
jgi:hypothetical protein